jgi:hypothetical protein
LRGGYDRLPHAVKLALGKTATEDALTVAEPAGEQAGRALPPPNARSRPARAGPDIGERARSRSPMHGSVDVRNGARYARRRDLWPHSFKRHLRQFHHLGGGRELFAPNIVVAKSPDIQAGEVVTAITTAGPTQGQYKSGPQARRPVGSRSMGPRPAGETAAVAF